MHSKAEAGGRAGGGVPSAAVQDHYPADAAHCFGCGRLNERGYRVKTFADGDGTVTRFTPAPQHTALPGFVYGGLIACLIDCHAMATASAAAERAAGREIGLAEAPRFVTASLQVTYVRPTPLGPELEIRGRVRAMTGRKATVEVRVLAAGQVTAQGEVVAVRAPASMKAGALPRSRIAD
jgi:acyl-coenzyme A thioesterase PaaI-like protein